MIKVPKVPMTPIPLPPEAEAAAVRYVRRRCPDADLVLDYLGLDEVAS